MFAVAIIDPEAQPTFLDRDRRGAADGVGEEGALALVARRGFMDVLVVPDGEEPSAWFLRDRLSRAWGRITRLPSGTFTIQVETDEGQSELQAGPHASLDKAMSEVARFTRGQVQLIGGGQADESVP